ncbi:MAG: YabP/YqfC family sporulation protein, partial [Agathobacter sp.]|nr:YabP/YqfC family sporulation protein [Agathobacter sp.]
IAVKAKCFPIQVTGENLSIEYYTADTLKICGRISRISLCS